MGGGAEGDTPREGGYGLAFGARQALSLSRSAGDLEKMHRKKLRSR